MVMESKEENVWLTSLSAKAAKAFASVYRQKRGPYTANVDILTFRMRERAKKHHVEKTRKGLITE
jgi:hypothetical protein